MCFGQTVQGRGLPLPNLLHGRWRYACGRRDSQDGPVIGEATISKTGSVEKYRAFNAKVANATGVHDLYLCFSNTNGDTRLDWWQFKQ